jgi:hypothetical protein
MTELRRGAVARHERDRPQRRVGHVLERDGHDLARAIDRRVAEELQPIGGRQVLAERSGRGLLEDGARAERGALDEGEQVGDLELASARCAVARDSCVTRDGNR